MEGGPAVGNIERKTNLGSRHCENQVKNLSKTRTKSTWPGVRSEKRYRKGLGVVDTDGAATIPEA